MCAVKRTISIDENIAKEVNAMGSNFSAIVEKALIEYIQQQRALKAIQSFGGWEKRTQESKDFVNQLRREDDREYVNRNNKATKTRRD